MKEKLMVKIAESLKNQTAKKIEGKESYPMCSVCGKHEMVPVCWGCGNEESSCNCIRKGQFKPEETCQQCGGHCWKDAYRGNICCKCNKHEKDCHCESWVSPEREERIHERYDITNADDSVPAVVGKKKEV